MNRDGAMGDGDSHLFSPVAASEDGSDGVSHAVVRAALSSNHVVLVHDGRRDEGGAKRCAEVIRKVAKDGAKPLFGIPCLRAEVICTNYNQENRQKNRMTEPTTKIHDRILFIYLIFDVHEWLHPVWAASKIRK